MPKNTINSCKKCRRESTKLFLKGEKCYSPKCPLVKKPYPPGMHGVTRRAKPSEYGLQLREKQKIKHIYGIRERQFRNYFKKASQKKGMVGENLLFLLESRIDTVIFRAGFANSISQARQLVKHSHFLVNDKKVNIPSFQIKPNDKIKAKSDKVYFKNLKEIFKKEKVVPWIKSDIKNFSIEFLRLPERQELDPSLKEYLVVELYSK